MTSKCSPDKSHYKVVEISTVTDETIENTLNTWSAQGWQFDQIQFVVRDSSRRPSMAFIFFTRPVGCDENPSFEIHKPVSDSEDPLSEHDEGEGVTL